MYRVKKGGACTRVATPSLNDKGYSNFGEFLVLSQIISIKLPRFVVLRRKEVKRYI
jgi:hypothetical protein